MKTILILCLTILIMSGFAAVSKNSVTQAYNPISGIISSDTTWSQYYTYDLTGNLLLQSGATLTIEPGVTVNLGNYYIMVNGTLRARGNDANPIYFNSGQIAFTSFSPNWNETASTGSIIEKSIINSNITLSNTAKINNNTINGEINVQTTTGIPVISRNTIKGDITVAPGGMPIIANNTLEGAGISLFMANATVTDNTISYGSVGIAAYTDFSGPAWFNCTSLIERNWISGNIDTGIAIREQQGSTPGSPVVRNNTITNNTNGIALSYIGIVAPNPTIINNNIYNNSNYNLKSNIPTNVNATHNWWGTTNTQIINQTIYDFKNDFNIGTVNFTPFLSAPNPYASPKSYEPTPPQPEGTDVGGTISDNTTWTPESAPYHFLNDLTVSRNTTLTITPGTTVNLNLWSLTIEGTLNARGNETHKILLQGNQTPPRAWPPRIYFNNSNPWNETSETGSIIEHAEIHVANYQYETILGNGAKISNNLIYNYGNDAGAVRTNGIISNNTIMGGYRGIVAENATIQYNTIKDADAGISCGFISYEPIYHPVIIGNLITNNSVGIDDWSSAPYIANNTIVNNTFGIRFTPYAFYRNATPAGIVFNNIYGNDLDAFTEAEDPLRTVEMNNNWWGTTNTTLIDQKIRDQNDNNILCLIDYLPILQAPNSEAPVIPEFTSIHLMLLIMIPFLKGILFLRKKTLTETKSA